jgi:ribosomal protein L29
MSTEKKTRVFKLRSKNVDELSKELDNYKLELGTLRVSKVSGGSAPKLAKIKVNT